VALGASVLLAACGGGHDGAGRRVDCAALPARFPHGSDVARERYPTHTVTATVFWIGEAADADDNFISNAETAWDDHAVRTFGGVDSTRQRRTFTPRHNTFYAALPAAEFDDGLIRGARAASPWAGEHPGEGQSLFKGRWIAVRHRDRTAYVQWVDVGPCSERDYAYVFGTAEPENTFDIRAGIDLSPDAAAYLRLDGSGTVRWRFVDAGDVPAGGPWRDYPAVDRATHWAP